MYKTVRRHWQCRLAYSTLYDWLLTLYSRLLRRTWLPFPFRRRICALRLRGVIEPFYFRLGTTDLLVIEEIFLRGEYDAILSERPIGARCVMDLGANAGYSLRFWKRCFPNARFVAVEPDRENARLCRMNCEAAAIDRALTLIEGFVGGSRREAVICGSEEWSYSIGNQKSLNEAPKALVYRFEDILSIAGVDGGIDLLKCDIEGAEREVFAECTGWLDRINNLFVELHPPYRERDFLADLRRQGAELQVVSRSKTETCPVLLLTREQPQRFATT